LPFVEEIALEDPNSRLARRPMKVAVVGLGAVGGLIAARTAAAGHAVSALARGETLARVRERGRLIDSAGGDRWRGSSSPRRRGHSGRRIWS
jgi:hypothetical protein